MSSTKIGKVAPFPPLPGQPYPPARNHPRWKEIYRLHDEWAMKYLPFSSEKKRARFPFINLAGFSTWSAPAADFDRMVLGARFIAAFFMADDYMDSGKMLDRISGFKKAATGTGPLHPEDRAEICHDIVFRAVKATCNPRTFSQLTKCAHEWWDSHVREPFRDLDHYISLRRVNVGAHLTSAYIRYTLDINLADEQVNHPLVREAEGIVGDHVGLVNDFFSYAKETMTNSDDNNSIRILQEQEGLTYEQAKNAIEKLFRQKERDFITAGLAVLNDPELGKDPEVRRWIASLPYFMGGNIAWSQETARYKVGDIPGIPFPSLSYELEATPPGEEIDQTEESLLRDKIFNVKDVPPPDFTVDYEPIETGDVQNDAQSDLLVSLFLPDRTWPRPEGIGIIAIEACVAGQCASDSEIGGPTRLLQECLAHGDGPRYTLAVALATVSSLLKKYNFDPLCVGRVEVATSVTFDTPLLKNALARLFVESDIEVGEYRANSAAALFAAVHWVESSSWDGRKVIILAADTSVSGASAIAMIVGPNAPIVVEPIRGTFTSATLELSWSENRSLDTYVTAFDKSYSSYRRKRSQSTNVSASKGSSASTDVADRTHPAHGDKRLQGTNRVNTQNGHVSACPVPPVTVTSSEFDYMVYGDSCDRTARLAHAQMHYHDHLTRPCPSIYSGISSSAFNSPGSSPSRKLTDPAFIQLSSEDYERRVAPSFAHFKRCGIMGTTSLYGGVASIICSVPGFDMFEKRIAMFAYAPETTNVFFVLRIKGDTKFIRETLNLPVSPKQHQPILSSLELPRGSFTGGRPISNMCEEIDGSLE